MWIDKAIRIIVRLYMALFAGQIIVWSIRPDSIRELIPILPFDIDPRDSRLIFSLALTLLLICVLSAWEKRRKLGDFLSLSSGQKLTTPSTGRRPSRIGFILFLIATVAGPLLLSYPPAFPEDTLSLKAIEEEYHSRLRSAADSVIRPDTTPSPDPTRDNLEWSHLPILELEIPPLTQHHLTAALPRTMNTGNSYFTRFSSETFSWPYLPAFFTHEGRRYPIDIRYRGWTSDHYLGFKKSWRIKFHKNDLFQGRRQFNLINQRDHSLINDILWSELLRESGLLVPFQFLAHVRINGSFVGVQTFLEQPDRYFAERHNRNASDIFGEEEPITGPAGFVNPDIWQQYASHAETKDKKPLLNLYRTILHKEHPDYLTRLSRQLDIDHYLKYLAHGAINCQENPSTHNIRWIRDPGVGRFQILPWYQAPDNFITTGYHSLWQRKGWSFYPPMVAINDLADGLLRHPQLRQRYLSHLWRMLASTHHRDRIRQKIDELETYVRPDAWADTHIHYHGDMRRYISNAEWETTIVRLRTMVDDRLDYMAKEVAGGPLKLLYNAKQEFTLIATNYADARLVSVTLDYGRPIETDKLRLIITPPGGGPRTTFRPTDTGLQRRITITPDQQLPAKVIRTPIPMGPGIIVVDLGRVPNPDLDFRGGMSKLAPHFQPQATAYQMSIVSPPGLEPVIESISVINNVTRRQLAIVGTNGSELFQGTPFSFPDYSPRAARELCPNPPVNARTPSATMESILPDGIVLRTTDPAVPLQALAISSDTVIKTNRIIAEDEHLTVAPGVTLRFAKDSSLIVYGKITAIGTAAQPIRFTSIDTDANWGAVFLNSLTDRTNRFEHCIFEHSTNTLINGLPVTAALAAYTAPVTVSNCTFRSITADDAFNSKYVSPILWRCSFSNNLDAIDIDMGGGRVTRCLFINNEDDCIDLSSSWVLIEGNDIHSHGDKGISVGEKSKPLIRNNIITDAAMGIAVKDLSEAHIENNTLLSNRTAVALYQKKPSFGPATAHLLRNVIHFNHQTISLDQGSRITAGTNTCSESLDGHGNIRVAPDYSPSWKLPPDSPLRSPIHLGAHR